MKKTPLLLIFCAFILHGCILDTKYDAEPFDGLVLPRVTGYQSGVTHDWLYFNLRTGEVFNRKAPNQEIREGEQLSRLDWDLAFCGYHMRTNGGTSGPGKGAAADLGRVKFGDVKSRSDLPEDLKWVSDDDTSVRIAYSQRDWFGKMAREGVDINDNPWFDPNSGIQTTLTSANPVLDTAIILSGPPITYTPSFHTYVIRTADGRSFFKLQIVNWYDSSAQIGDTGGRISYYLDPLP